MRRPSSHLLDIVIPTCDRPDALRRCLAALAPQSDYIGVVIVVDDGTIPVTKDRSWGLLNVSVIQSPHQGPCLARNQALEEVTAGQVAFLDDDSIPCPTWAESCLRLFEEFPEITGQLGRIRWSGVSPDVSGRMARWRDSFLPRIRQKIYDSRHLEYTNISFRDSFSSDFKKNIPPQLPGIAQHLSGGNGAIRTSFLQGHGFLDPRFKTFHDRELAFRVFSRGGLIAYNPTMEIDHDHDPSVLRSLKRCIRAVPYQRLLDTVYPDLFWLSAPSLLNSGTRRHHTKISTSELGPLEKTYLMVFSLVQAIAFKIIKTPSDDPLAAKRVSL